MSVVHRTVKLDISGPVRVLVQHYHDWMSQRTAAHCLSPVDVMLDTGMVTPFVEYVLYEIFKEHYLSDLYDHIADSDRNLRDSLGVPLEIGGRWKMEFLNTVVAIIGAYLPDLNFMRVEDTQYGISENYLLVIHVDADLVPR